MQTRIAIYDLDKTLLTHATFTPFLLFAAWRRAAWRLVFVPMWIAAMVGYKAKLFSRGALKQIGLRMFLGGVRQEDLDRLARDFADRIVPAWIGGGARQALERDRADGAILVLATAAMDFYAAEIARRIGFDHVIATRNAAVNGGVCLIEGGNCYGTEKPPRVEALLFHLGLRREECVIKFYSDSVSDAPLLDWVDKGVLVNAGPAARRKAQARGWQVADFR